MDGKKFARVPYTVSFALPNIDVRLLSEIYSYIEEEIPEKVGGSKRRIPPQQERKQITRSVVGRSVAHLVNSPTV